MRDLLTAARKLAACEHPRPISVDEIDEDGRLSPRRVAAACDRCGALGRFAPKDGGGVTVEWKRAEYVDDFIARIFAIGSVSKPETGGTFGISQREILERGEGAHLGGTFEGAPCGCVETYPQLRPGRGGVNHHPDCAHYVAAKQMLEHETGSRIEDPTYAQAREELEYALKLESAYRDAGHAIEGVNTAVTTAVRRRVEVAMQDFVRAEGTLAEIEAGERDGERA